MPVYIMHAALAALAFAMASSNSLTVASTPNSFGDSHVDHVSHMAPPVSDQNGPGRGLETTGISPDNTEMHTGKRLFVAVYMAFRANVV